MWAMAVTGHRLPPRVPRGRHAPPLEVRVGVQRRRLLEAAAAVFAERGYAEGSAEAISRAAGMSKATFYEHFANKEECILVLFDEAATEVMRAMAAAGEGATFDRFEARVEAGARAFCQTLAEHPEYTQTLLVEIIGAGPRAAARRDAILQTFAEAMFRDFERAAPRYGAGTFASHDDAFGIIGASVELVSRQLRTGRPDDMLDLAPVITRLALGALQPA
jgi:AcrR family transcriptional regulator